MRLARYACFGACPVELHFPDRRRCALLTGPSGCGKSVLLRALAAMLRGEPLPEEADGEIELSGGKPGEGRVIELSAALPTAEEAVARALADAPLRQRAATLAGHDIDLSRPLCGGDSLLLRMAAALSDASPGIALIDNLGDSLDPRTQRRIARRLTTAFPETQFICATNSVAVAATGADAAVRIPLAADEPPTPGEGSEQTALRLLRATYGLESLSYPYADSLRAERDRLLAIAEPTADDEALLDAVTRRLRAIGLESAPADPAEEAIRRSDLILERLARRLGVDTDSEL